MSKVAYRSRTSERMTSRLPPVQQRQKRDRTRTIPVQRRSPGPDVTASDRIRVFHVCDKFGIRGARTHGVSGLAAGVLELLERPALAAELGAQAGSDSRRFDVRRTVAELQELYQELVDRRR
jgi:hypothetical protein